MSIAINTMESNNYARQYKNTVHGIKKTAINEHLLEQDQPDNTETVPSLVRGNIIRGCRNVPRRNNTSVKPGGGGEGGGNGAIPPPICEFL